MSFAPFFIGLAGSMHCVAMCGPLASLVSGTGRNSLWMRVLYNGGRILTYGVLGAVLTYLGVVSSLSGMQEMVSIAVGCLFLIIGFTGLQVTTPRIVTNVLVPLSGFLKARFSILLGMKTPLGILTMGLINGLLPCGMTWLALTYCVTLQSPSDGFLAMLIFGIGTLPAMLGFATIINKIVSWFKISFKRVQTILIIATGCLLIARTLIHNPTPAHSAGDGIVVCGSHKFEQP
jgi:sulfite exporter TauE/SafE